MSSHIIDHTLINKEITELALGQLLNERGISYQDIRRLRKPYNENLMEVGDSNETTEDDFKWILNNLPPRRNQSLKDYASEITPHLYKLLGRPEMLPAAV